MSKASQRRYAPQDGKWSIVTTANGLKEARERIGEENFSASKAALKKYLCEYFSTGNDCAEKQGAGISPVGATPKGGKILKVRWGLPGCGKSGGLRLAVVAYCSELRVVIAEAFLRRDDPSDADFETATKDL